MLVQFVCGRGKHGDALVAVSLILYQIISADRYFIKVTSCRSHELQAVGAVGQPANIETGQDDSRPGFVQAEDGIIRCHSQVGVPRAAFGDYFGYRPASTFVVAHAYRQPTALFSVGQVRQQDSIPVLFVLACEAHQAPLALRLGLSRIELDFRPLVDQYIKSLFLDKK